MASVWIDLHTTRWHHAWVEPRYGVQGVRNSSHKIMQEMPTGSKILPAYFYLRKMHIKVAIRKCVLNL